jgi:integrase
MLPFVTETEGNMAKRHLTDKSVQHLKPPVTGEVQVFDLGYPGLALRVGHGGAKSFELFYRTGGKQRRERLGRWPQITLADARDAWRKTRELIAKGEEPSSRNGAKAPAMLFERVVEDWLKRDQSKNKPSTFYQVTRSVEGDLLPAWRGKRVDEITKRDVIELLDSIADRGAPIMARSVQAFVGRFFAWCVERDILKIDPTAGMSRIGNGNSRNRVLSDDELAKVWGAAVAPNFGAATRLLILTGARREEITKLRWSEIDGDSIKLEGDRTKTGAPHIIPLSAAARTIIDGLPRISGSDFVFTSDGTKPLKGWPRNKLQLDAKSGVADWVIHDLRRTVATGLQKLGISLQTVESVLGHVSGSRGGVVGIYQRHDFLSEKREALKAWGAYVLAICT